DPLVLRAPSIPAGVSAPPMPVVLPAPSPPGAPPAPVPSVAPPVDPSVGVVCTVPPWVTSGPVSPPQADRASDTAPASARIRWRCMGGSPWDGSMRAGHAAQQFLRGLRVGTVGEAGQRDDADQAVALR